MSAPWTRVAAFLLALRGQDFPQRAPQMVFVCSATIKKANIWCNLLADRDRHMVGARRAWMLGKTHSRLCSGFEMLDCPWAEWETSPRKLLMNLGAGFVLLWLEPSY